MSSQRRQQLVLKRREMHALPGPCHQAACKVNADVPGHDRRIRSRMGLNRRAAQRDANACNEFADAERLLHVVGGACVESRDLVLLLSSGRDNDDRQRGPFQDALDDLNAIHVRQAKIETDVVRPALRCFKNSTLTRIRFDKTPAGRFDCRAKKSANRQLIFDEQYVYRRGSHVTASGVLGVCTGAAGLPVSAGNSLGAPGAMGNANQKQASTLGQLRGANVFIHPRRA